MTDHKVAIVTGGSRGIGRAIALRLGREGVAVCINYTNGADDADEVAARIVASGGQAISHKADVADPAAVKAMFDAAEQRLGTVDIVVAAAGIFKPLPIAETSDAEFDLQFAVNVRGTFNCLREAARRLNDKGRIITFSSSTLLLTPPGYGIYNACKGAIEGMTRVLAKEIGGRGITVNAIAPGPVETELFLDGKSQEEIAARANGAPLGRLGQPEDIAEVAAFLSSPEAQWVNGQIIRVNGGLA